MFKINEKKFVYSCLISLFIIFIILSFLSQGAYGGADNITHYDISRYAFKYPHLFLNSWGKPLFTALSSPFAQFGFNGIKIFNIIIGLLTAYFSYLIVKEINYKNAFLVILFVVFSPLYFIMLFTSLTEILFSFVVILAVYLFFKDKYVFSAIVISFLPFARNEGFVIIPIFLLAYLINKKYKAIPFLITGVLFYSIIGYFYYHDFFWVITQNPYTLRKSIYGSGSLFHFVKSTKSIIGIPLGILLLIGLFYYILQFFRNGKTTKVKIINEMVLIFLPFLVYFFAHSYVWWRGLGGSLGLIRVIAGVIPLAAIISLKGYNFIDKLLSFNKSFKYVLLIFTIFIVVRTTFITYKMPIKYSPAEQLIEETSNWLKSSKYNKEKIFYFDPYFNFYLHLDPYDNERSRWMIHVAALNENDVSENGIIIWDAHFGPNEGRMPIKRLLSNKNFKLLKVFHPVKNFKVLGGYNYEIYVFQNKQK